MTFMGLTRDSSGDKLTSLLNSELIPDYEFRLVGEALRKELWIRGRPGSGSCHDCIEYFFSV